MNQDQHFEYGVICPTHSVVKLSEAEYIQQLNKPNALWTCPKCGQVAAWDDDSGCCSMNIIERVGIAFVEGMLCFWEWVGGLVCRRKGHDFEEWRGVVMTDGTPYNWRFCNRCNALETNLTELQR